MGSLSINNFQINYKGVIYNDYDVWEKTFIDTESKRVFCLYLFN